MKGSRYINEILAYQYSFCSARCLTVVWGTMYEAFALTLNKNRFKMRVYLFGYILVDD